MYHARACFNLCHPYMHWLLVIAWLVSPPSIHPCYDMQALRLTGTDRPVARVPGIGVYYNELLLGEGRQLVRGVEQGGTAAQGAVLHPSIPLLLPAFPLLR